MVKSSCLNHRGTRKPPRLNLSQDDRDMDCEWHPQDLIGEVMWHESTAAAALLRYFFDYPLLYLQEMSQTGNRVAAGIER